MSDADSTAHVEVEYRSITGFSSYKIGSDGTIWTCNSRAGRGPDGKLLWKQTSSWRRLSVHATKSGRERCELARDDGVAVKHFVHRLVLFAFVGPQPDGMECCHRDGNPRNNSVSNLRWGTHNSNIKDKVLHGTVLVGEKIPWSKLTSSDVLEIRLLADSGMTFRDISRRFNVTSENISMIVRRKTWCHI